MQKIKKNYYYNKNGEKKINSYMIYISKELIRKSNINETDNIEVKTDGEKIIIEKAK